MVEVRQTELFAHWFKRLRAPQARVRIQARLRRLSLGNPVMSSRADLEEAYGLGRRWAIGTPTMNILIETKRLLLRDYRTDDWERVHIYGSMPDFSQFEAWGPNTVEETKRFIAIMTEQAQQNPRFRFDFAVCLKEDGLLIGGGGIRRESQTSKIANLGWAINPDFQGKGYATEAATALIKFGFEQLDLLIIYATCDTRNSASFKVMEKAGLKRVGLLEKDREQKGHLRDTLRYEVLRS
jgi:RimJ/RimL family protein N-acetyltransferase